MNSTITLKSILFLFIAALALNTTNMNAQQNTKFGILNFNKAINISGKQRMLTQKMAKSYLFLVEHPQDAQAKKDLLTSKIIFEKQNNIIMQNASYQSTKNRINNVDTLWTKFKSLLETTPSYDNAKKIIDLNTDLLKATDNVVSSVISESKEVVRSNNDVLDDEEASSSDLELKKTINMAGRQRMLSQRLALYYFANQNTLKDKNTERMLSNVYNEIDGAITVLLISDFNTNAIDEKLALAMSKWEIIRDNKEKLSKHGFSDAEIYKISNDLLKAFNSVTILYEKVKI